MEIAGRHDCHSPKSRTEFGPVPDPARLLSGHPAEENLAAINDPAILRDYALFNMGLTAGTGPWVSLLRRSSR